MADLILSIPPAAGALLSVAITIALALSTYGLTRRLLVRPGEQTERDLANSVLVRVSALHALILALVFAQELVNLRDVNEAATREAAMVGDVFYDLGRYDPEETRPIRENLARYTHLVLTEEWAHMAVHQTLHAGAWEAWDDAYGQILSLTPGNDRQEVLKDIMVREIRTISALAMPGKMRR